MQQLSDPPLFGGSDGDSGAGGMNLNCLVRCHWLYPDPLDKEQKTHAYYPNR